MTTTPETPWKLTVKTTQLLFNGSWEMHTALVYQGAHSLIAMWTDGDPDITQPGTCKVDIDQITKHEADTILADAQVTAVYRNEAA